MGATSQRVVVGDDFDLSLEATDPGGLAIDAVSIDWGDGSSPDTYSSVPSSATHAYAAAGTFPITLTAHDTDSDTNYVIHGPTFDAGFGEGGTAHTSVGTGLSGANATAADADGGILLAGDSGGDFALTRFTAGGVLDTSFGADHDGKALLPFSQGTAHARAITLLDDGEILVAGDVLVSGHFRFALARLHQDGSADTVFGDGSDGEILTAFGSVDARANALAVDPATGDITLAGFAGGDLALARYDSSGAPLTSFGSGGTLTVDLGSNVDIGYGIKIDPAGNIVATGRSSDDLFLIRLTPDGELDSTFGASATPGIRITDFGTGDFGYDLDFDALGRIVVAGESSGASIVARYSATGVLDTSFGSGGKAINLFPENSSGYAYHILALPDGSIIAGGLVARPAYAAFYVARFTDDGDLDTGFAENGVSLTHIAGSSLLHNDSINALGVVAVGGQAGKFIGAGVSQLQSGYWDFSVTRYLPGDAVTAVNPPTSPFSLRAVPLSRSEVELAWKMDEEEGNPEGFVIQRSTDGGAHFSPFAVVDDGSARSYDVSGLDPLTDYDFRVDAVVDGGDGELGDGDDFTGGGEDSATATTTNDQWQDMDESVTPDIVSGDISYFNGGDDLPAGQYRLLYDGGAVNYDQSEDQSDPQWLAMDYYAASDGNLLNGGLGGQGNPGGQEGIAYQPSLADAEHEATPTIWEIENPGGPIGVGFYNPSASYSGPGVTWRLQRYVPHISVQVLDNADATTEGDDAHPAKLYFAIDDGYNGYHYNEPLTVKFDVSGTATTGDLSQYSAVMLIPEGEDEFTRETVNLASGQFTVPANVHFGVEIDITANNDTVPEWTQDLNLRLQDDLPHYVVDHYVDFDGIDTNGSEPDPDATIGILDNDIGLSLEAASYTGVGALLWVDHGGDNTEPLVPLHLGFPEDIKQGAKVTLSVSSPGIEVWPSSQPGVAGSEILSPTKRVQQWVDGTDAIPTVVYVEATDASAYAADTVFQLDDDDSTAEEPSPFSKFNSCQVPATKNDFYIERTIADNPAEIAPVQPGQVLIVRAFISTQSWLIQRNCRSPSVAGTSPA